MSRYPRYPKYKDSGVEWIGEVPEHWETVRVKHVAPSVEQGWSPQCDPAEAGPGEWGVLKVGCVNGSVFDPHENKALPATLDPVPSLAVNTGDVLVSRANTRELVGSCAKVTANYPRLMLCDKLYRLRPSDRITSDLLARVIQAVGRETIEMAASGTSASMVNISMDTIRNLKFFLPPPSEQSAITTAIDRETTRIDALIAKKSRFIELLGEKRQALITRAVTKGLDPDAAMKDSGIEWIGEVPAHWRVPKLRHIATVQTGVAKGKDVSGLETISVPYLRVANVQDGYLDLTDLATIEVPKADLPRYLLQPGDVLMNEGGDGDKLGRGHIWPGKIHPCIHQNHVFAVRPHGVSSAWLNTYTGSIPAQRFFAAKAKQTTNLASISSGSLMDLPVPQPPAKEQEAILMRVHRSVKRIDELLAKTTRSLALLKERRDAFITAAVTGQIDLRDTVPPAQRDTACTP